MENINTEIELPAPVPSFATDDLWQQIYAYLKTQILERNFQPGQRLHLGTLAIQLGVSRTPVRDALQQLALEGLVVVHPRRGTFVASFGPKDVQELYDLVEMMDLWAVGKLPDFRSVSQQMQEVIRMMPVLEAGSSLEESQKLSTELDRKFHAIMIKAAGQERLIHLHRDVRDKLFLIAQYIRVSWTVENLQITWAEHQAIVNGLLAEQPDVTAIAISTHLRNACQRAVRVLQEHPAR